MTWGISLDKSNVRNFEREETGTNTKHRLARLLKMIVVPKKVNQNKMDIMYPKNEWASRRQQSSKEYHEDQSKSSNGTGPVKTRKTLCQSRKKVIEDVPKNYNFNGENFY
jgi:hypothetical protein